MRYFLFIVLALFIFNYKLIASSPEHISYYKIYEYLDEIASTGDIDLNSAVKPYSKKKIVELLNQINTSKSSLNFRQKEELMFYLKAYDFEFKSGSDAFNLNFISPGICWKDSNFRALMKPILGIQITGNSQGSQIRRWYGASIDADFSKNWNIWGSLRDISHQGTLLSKPNYLNQEPGYQYTVGTDYSDSRGGISFENKLLRISFSKDHITWGDNLNGSNIFSGRTPSFPFVNFKLKPTNWFELNYIHGWLVSNVVDSSRYYIENGTTIHYRPANKFIAANFFTFTPLRNLKLSLGNSIVYAESTVIPSYLLPIAFYKSMDHSLTKGISTENQNSQLFINLSSRNFKSVHIFSSVYIDEIQLARFSTESPQKNPISYKIGAKYYNILNSNFSVGTEFTRTNILNYKHSIPTLTWASNSYNLGHYLGDNSSEFYLELQYKPLRSLDFKISYTDAQKGNEFQYIRRGTYKGIYGKVDQIIAYPYMKDIIWKNQSIALNGTYEISKDNYFILNFVYNNAQAFDAKSETMFGEDRMTSTEVLNLFTPSLLIGKNLTTTIGFSFGF